MTNTESRNLRPGVVIHFNALNKTSVDGRTNISAGVGTSVLPVFVPFANASLSRAEQVDMNHPVDPTVQTVSGVLGSGFGSVVYSREKSPMNTFEQMQYQLSEKCNQLARMSLDEIMADPTLDDYYKYRIQSVYDQA